VRQAHGGLQPVLLASSVAAEMACLWLAEGQVNAWR
jgi:hypothetical protein